MSVPLHPPDPDLAGCPDPRSPHNGAGRRARGRPPPPRTMRPRRFPLRLQGMAPRHRRPRAAAGGPPPTLVWWHLPQLPGHMVHANNHECEEEAEWPPSTLILPVFSSKSESWEERTFGRQGAAAGMLPGMVGSLRIFFKHHSAYWRGALYICCSNCFVMRISLSNSTYQAIELPTEDAEFYLGKSVNGIYCASLFQGFQLQVWFLNDPCVHGQTKWVLKHDRDIFSILPNLNYDKQRDGPWILQEFRYWGNEDADDDSPIVYNKEATVEQKFVWDSDNDDVLEPGDRSNDCCIIFLGFHPYKEVVFLSDKFDRVLAYNWSSSKLQDLGKVFPKFYTDSESDYYHQYVKESFPYTPCWLGELPEKMNLLEAH